VQELESEDKKYQELLSSRNNKQERLETNLKLLKTQIVEERNILEQLQGQTSLLQGERDLLQNQVWELLQQLENLNPQSFVIAEQENVEEFAFADLVETISTEPTDTAETSEEWTNLLKNLPNYEIQVLKAILEQENPNAAIKQIAEENITMPNLLIDSINERAKDIIGELIISTSNDIPEIYEEYQQHIQRLTIISQKLKSKEPSK
ncbi:MAG: tellurite resistance TerB C-terminal domain-containing protein, partial [Rivularia sp. (in: cyanobacteria)]